MSLGASGDVFHCLELARETPQLARSKGGGNQLERFLLKRASKMASEAEEVDPEYCRLLGYELLYLWNALGACLKHSQSEIRIGNLCRGHPQTDYALNRPASTSALVDWNGREPTRKGQNFSLQIFLTIFAPLPSDCDRICVPSLEGVRQLILGSVHSNSGAVVAAKQSYGRAIKHSR